MENIPKTIFAHCIFKCLLAIAGVHQVFSAYSHNKAPTTLLRPHLPSCQASPTRPPWSLRFLLGLHLLVSVLRRPPPRCHHWRTCTCRCTLSSSSPCFVSSASCSCWHLFMLSVYTAPLTPHPKICPWPWSARTPLTGALPLKTIQWGIWSDCSLENNLSVMLRI